MTARRMYRPDPLAVDELAALDAGHGCGLCLDFGHLNDAGPCPNCAEDPFAEYLLDHANGQVATTWAEEHDPNDQPDLVDVLGEVA